MGQTVLLSARAAGAPDEEGRRQDRLPTKSDTRATYLSQADTQLPLFQCAFTLASEIVAHVLGKSFAEFYRDAIFRPLGMNDTQFHDDIRRLAPNRADSYRRGRAGWERAVYNSATVGASISFMIATAAICLELLAMRNIEPGCTGTLFSTPATVAARQHETALVGDGERRVTIWKSVSFWLLDP